jgi:hypothetical protein
MTDKQKEYYFSIWEKDFYEPFGGNRILESHDYESIAIGFFIASGLSISDSIRMYEYCISKDKY